MRAMECALYIERELRRAPSLEIRTNFLLAMEDKPKTCAIVSLLRSSDSLNREGKASATGRTRVSKRRNEPGLPQSDQK